MPDRNPPDPRSRDYVRPEFIRAAAELPDQEDGLRRVIGVVQAGFEAEYAASRQSLEDEEAWIGPRVAVLKDELASVDAEIADLPEVRPAAKANADREGGGERIEIPIREWQLRDQVSAFLCFSGGMILLATSWMAAKNSLDAAHLPIFIDTPALSWLISFLVPAAAIATKSLHGLFEGTEAKRAYRRAVYAVAGVSFAVYWALFALLFKSLSGEDDPLAEPSALAGWGFVFLQGLAEVAVAASLMLNVDAIFDRYTPEYSHENSLKERLRLRRKEIVAEIEALEERLNAVRGRLAELAGILAFNLERAELAFAQARARRFDGLV